MLFLWGVCLCMQVFTPVLTWDHLSKVTAASAESGPYDLGVQESVDVP